MLTADQIETLRVETETVLDPLINWLIVDVAKRVAQAGQLTSTVQYQVWRLQNLGLSQKEIKNRVAAVLNQSTERVEQFLTQAAETGYNFDLSALPTQEAIPFSENAVIQQILSAAVQMGGKELENITGTLGFVCPDGISRPMTEAYQNTCDFAFTQVATGATDYNTAIRNALRGLRKQGIQKIEYTGGRSISVDAAIRRNVFSALGTMQEKISQTVHDDTGCDGWEISAHAASAPDHEPIQGRQYRDDEYQRLNDSLIRRIGTLNCGHAAFPIVYGVSTPTYTEKELEQLRKENAAGIEYEGKHYTQYEAKQRQRAIERQIRKTKRDILIDDAVKDEKQLQKDRIRYVRLSEEYKRFNEAAGLKSQHARLEEYGFDHKQAKAAEKEEERFRIAEQKRIEQEKIRAENLKYIENDAKIKEKSGLPKRVDEPDTELQHTVNVDLPKIKGIVPQKAELTKVYTMAGEGTCVPIRDLKRLYLTYPEYGDASHWKKKAGKAYAEYHHYEIHWYEHEGRIPVDEIKLKGAK